MNLRINSLFLILATALVAVVGDWSGNDFAATLWRFPAGLILLGLAYESLVVTRTRTSIIIEAPERWLLGRKTRICFKLTHQLGREVSVQLAPDGPESFLMNYEVQLMRIPAKASVDINLEVCARRLGSHSWPTLRSRVSGPLGLAWWSVALRPQFTVDVVPDILDIHNPAQGLAISGDRITQRRGTGTELLQLRPYQQGDPPRIIDWKASARVRELVSRDFSEDQHLDIILAIDIGRGSSLRAGKLDRLGHYANVASRFVQHAVEQDDRVGLVLYADRPLIALPPLRGNTAVMRLRQCIASIKMESVESNPLHAAVRVRSLIRHRSLIVFFTDLDDTTATSQLVGAIHLLTPKHLPFITGLRSTDAEHMARMKAIHWLDPYHALSAQEYCSGLERRVAALHSMGVPAIAARPEQLESEVFNAYVSFKRKRRI